MTPPPAMERYENLTSEEFAARIRAARAYLGLRLGEAGKALGISRQALSRRENNDERPPYGSRYAESINNARRLD